MKREIIQKAFASEEEYFAFEEKSELKHELYNGNLIIMSGVSVDHNEITLNIAILLRQLLKRTNFKVFIEAVKVKNPLGNFFYPDVMVCHPNPEKYFSTEPVLLVEVLSENTRKYGLVDKFIQYQKIESLQYYLCVEPEQQVVILFNKDADGDWVTETFSKDEDTINLPKLGTSFTLKQIYKPE
jgi:Uma2 family endonuclease